MKRSDARRERGRAGGFGIDCGRGADGAGDGYVQLYEVNIPVLFKEPSYIAGVVMLLVLGFVLVKVPLANAGRPEDPAPPAVIT